MHAMYLRSVRSPLLARGRFKLNAAEARDDVNVFSQTVRESEDDEYEEDSFCVASSQIDQSGAFLSFPEFGVRCCM